MDGIITAIKPAVRDTQRVNIFIDEKFSFSLTISQLLDTKLKVGSILSPEKKLELEDLSHFGKIYQRSLEYCLVRPRSIKEVRDYLERCRIKKEIDLRLYESYKKKSEVLSFSTIRGWKSDEEKVYTKKNKIPKKPSYLISKDNIEKTINKLIKNKYLNDDNFTRFYVENRHLKKGISHKLLRLELLKKGIDAETINRHLLDSDIRADKTEIKKIIQKKLRLKKYDNQKLIQYLVRQGFDFELAQSSVLEMDLQNSGQNLF